MSEPQTMLHPELLAADEGDSLSRDEQPNAHLRLPHAGNCGSIIAHIG